MSSDGAVLRPEDFAIRAELVELRQEHRDLDEAITALAQRSTPDLLQLQRMKKRKLLLKDRIARLQDKLLPDIIA